MNTFRRTTIGLMLSVMAAGIGLGSSASAQTVMRISISSPQNSHQGVAIDTFAKEVERLTNGRYVIKTFYASSLGAEREAMESVQMGTQELTWTSSGPVPNFVPEVKILDVPYLFTDYAHARGVLDGPIGDEMLKKFEPKGFKALAWAENGFRHMTNNKHPIKVPADMQGLKMRTVENPVHIQAYKAFGINPTPMAFSEVFTALQQGTVDGQENPLSVITASKFDQVQKYLTLTGHVYSPGVYLMNKDAFDKLSDEDKKAFIEAARIGVKANRDRIDSDEKNAVADLRSKGMEVVETIDKAQFQAALEPIMADFNKQFGKENLDRIRAAK
ncbi:TRAP transporter substrate-binding protein [Pollutimonas sp. M17]|uniref:TRAP transporter substrate-binding protein n=1 Tax=Pollutimonas sp. M17 TaxID=2962065 RepID=UPI0021F45C4B|nr:TRAP transporter substrate-binding protein [Pollutimonas sp. M17]UYO92979.1 TRAP transporter substrate-binding protein [Pollutimonas sp. M17]HWK72585.1 TRAP transporter substrate-binding protein [Burkholderiaceae bacterium]